MPWLGCRLKPKQTLHQSGRSGGAMYIVTTLFSCTRLWKTVPSQRFDKKLTIYANTLRHGVPDTNSELVEQLLLSITTKNP